MSCLIGRYRFYVSQNNATGISVKIESLVIIHVGKVRILVLTGLTGEKVALVGGFTSPSRSDVKALIISGGGKYRGGGVSSDTTLVVVGDCTEYNQKVRSARAMGIKVVPLDDFMTSMDLSDSPESGVVTIEDAPQSNNSSPATSTSRFSEASVSELVEVLCRHTFGAEITSEYAFSLLESKGMPIFMDEVQIRTRRDYKAIELKIRELRLRDAS